MSKPRKSPPHPAAYRHWLEQPVLAITLLLLFAAPFALLSLTGGQRFEVITEDPTQAAIILAAIILSLLLLATFSVAITVTLTLWTARRKLGRLRRGAVRASEEQFPALHTLAQAVSAALDIQTPVTVYLLDTTRLPQPTAPISVLGVTKPYVIMLSTALVGDMEPDELRFLLGVEYGHVKLGHVRILTMIDAVSGSLGRVPFVGDFIRVLFLAWTRLATFSADRAGLIACGRLDPAYNVLGKLTVGRRFWPEVNHVALAQQASRTRGRFFDAANRTTVPFDTAPLGRFQRLAVFSATPLFHELCPDADLSFPYLELWR